jgi:hypothetical protein
MSADREATRPLSRVVPVPMIHWENGRACAGPRPARPAASPAIATAASEATPPAHPPPPRGARDA